MKQFLVKRCALQALNIIKPSTLQIFKVTKRNALKLVLGAVVCTPNVLVCLPGWSMVKTTCDSAEKTVPPLALRSLAKVIEMSNDHKVLGGAVVGLAGVGALYILTRPYVWANNRTEAEKRRTEFAKIKVEIAEKFLIKNRLIQVTAEKDRLQGLLALQKEKEEIRLYQEDREAQCAQKSGYPVVVTGKNFADLAARFEVLEREHAKLKSQVNKLESDGVQARGDQRLLHTLVIQLGLVKDNGQPVSDKDAEEILADFVLKAYKMPEVADKRMVESGVQTSKRRVISDSAVMPENSDGEQAQNEESSDCSSPDGSVQMHDDHDDEHAVLMKTMLESSARAKAERLA
jgi:hypothetical protein